MPHRKTCLLILLGVLAGHALLTLHATSHAAAEQQTCQLCTHYSGTHAAPAPLVPHVFACAHALPPPVLSAPFLPAATVADCRQRGPPLAA